MQNAGKELGPERSKPESLSVETREGLDSKPHEQYGISSSKVGLKRWLSG